MFISPPDKSGTLLPLPRISPSPSSPYTEAIAVHRLSDVTFYQTVRQFAFRTFTVNNGAKRVQANYCRFDDLRRGVYDSGDYFGIFICHDNLSLVQKFFRIV